MYTVVSALTCMLCYLVFVHVHAHVHVHVHFVYRVLIRCTSICMMYCDLCFQLKLRNVVMMQQEKLLGEREAALEKQRQETESLKSSLTQKDEEVSVCTVQVTLLCPHGHIHVMLS